MKKKDLKIGDCVAIGKAIHGVSLYRTKKAYILATHAKITKDMFNRIVVESLTGGRYILAATCLASANLYEATWLPAHITSNSILCPWDEAQKILEERQERIDLQRREGEARLIREADYYAAVCQKLNEIGSQWLPIQTNNKSSISIPTETLLKILNHTLPLTK